MHTFTHARAETIPIDVRSRRITTIILSSREISYNDYKDSTIRFFLYIIIVIFFLE